MKKKVFFTFFLVAIILLVTAFSIQRLQLAKKIQQTPYLHNFPLELVWSFDSDYRILRPARIANDVAIIHTEKRPLEGFFQITHIALNIEDGTILWELPLSQYIGWDRELHWSFSEENAFFIGGNKIIAANLATGLPPWPSKRYGSSTVISNNDNVFVASFGFINAFDANTGSEQWRNSSDSLPHHFVMFYDEELNILVVPERDTIYILNADTGEIVQQQQIEEDEGWDFYCSNWLDTITYYEERIYCGPMAVDLYTGEVVSNKKFRYSGGHVWRPLIKDNIMYFPAALGTIRALDLNTFELLWEFKPNSVNDNNVRIISGAAVLDGAVYAIADNGFLYAFDIETGEEIGWWQSPEGVVDWTKGWSGSTPILGVVSDGEKLYVNFGKQTLYTFEKQDE